MSNKIPSVSYLLFDIYTICHTMKSLSTNRKLTTRIMQKYNLKETYYVSFFNQQTGVVEQEDLIYGAVVGFKTFLNSLLMLSNYNNDYTHETFTIDFFRQSPYYTIALIYMNYNYLELYYTHLEEQDKSIIKLCLDYEFEKLNKLFGKRENTMLIEDGTLFAEHNTIDPFLVGLKEDLLKIINFNINLNINATPISVIINREEEPNIDIKEQLLQQLKQLNPTQFEKFSLYIIKKIAENITGTSDEDIRIKHNGQVGDGGIDGIVELKNMFYGYDIYLVQCKRYNKTSIGSPELQAFAGAMMQCKRRYKVTKGIFITTSSFTKTALEFIEDVSHDYDIKTMDGKSLVNYMLEHKIGITEKTQTIQTIDIPFFQQFSL